MKICFSTLGCPDWSFPEIIYFASDIGFDGVEIRGVKGEHNSPLIPEFSAGNIDATKKKLQSLSLSIPCLSTDCNLNSDSAFDDSMEYIDTASSLGAPYIRLLGDPTPNPSGDVDLKAIANNLSRIAEYAKTKGITPLVETNGFFAKTRILSALLSEIGTNKIGVLYDIHHPYRFFGESPEYTIKNVGKYIRHVHIKDSVIDSKIVKYRMLGEGTIPVKEAVRALEQSGYGGFYSFEWPKRWDLSLEEPDIAFVQFKKFMETL